MLIFGIILSAIAGIYGFIMAMYVEIWGQNLSYQVMFGFDALFSWAGRMAILIVSKLNSSTRIILKAIETLSNKQSK